MICCPIKLIHGMCVSHINERHLVFSEAANVSLMIRNVIFNQNVAVRDDSFGIEIGFFKKGILKWTERMDKFWKWKYFSFLTEKCWHWEWKYSPQPRQKYWQTPDTTLQLIGSPRSVLQCYLFMFFLPRFFGSMLGDSGIKWSVSEFSKSWNLGT